MKCGSCGSDRMRPSHPRSWVEGKLRQVTGTRYYRCSQCGKRARYVRSGREGAAKRRDLRFWAWAVLAGVGFLVLLRFVG